VSVDDFVDASTSANQGEYIYLQPRPEAV